MRCELVCCWSKITCVVLQMVELECGFCGAEWVDPASRSLTSKLKQCLLRSEGG